MAEVLGWVSSIVLLATLVQQVYQQWREQRVEGVSRYLFAGQLSASLGFCVYSILLKNWVFVVTNALLLVNALVGLVLTWHLRRKKRTKTEWQEHPRAAQDSGLPSAPTAARRQ